MAAYLETFYAGLRAAIGACLPDVVDIWEDVPLERWPFEDLVRDGRLPLAVIQTDLQPAERQPMDGALNEGPVVIYYLVDDTGPATAPALRTLLETLRDYLWHDDEDDPVPGGQVMDEPTVSVGTELPPNEYFLNRNMPFWSGAVTFPALVGQD